MNSFRFQSKSSAKPVVGAFVIAMLATSASAQTAPSISAPPPPAVAPSPIVPGFGPATQQRVEKPIPLPQGATIKDAETRVRDIAAEANKSLDDLVGMTSREQYDVDAMASRQRQIMLLKDQLETVRLAKQVWKELKSTKGDGSDEGDDASNEKLKKIEEEKAFLEKRLRETEEKSAQDAAATEAGQLPVVSSITGSGGSATARLLVPFYGVVSATSGTTLPNGLKVVSIGATGVTATKDGKTFTLPYGSSVPRYKTTNKQGQTAALPR